MIARRRPRIRDRFMRLISSVTSSMRIRASSRRHDRFVALGDNLDDVLNVPKEQRGSRVSQGDFTRDIHRVEWPYAPPRAWQQRNEETHRGW